MILFVSPDPGDGKSTLVADLALVQRDAGERVVIVEANFRRPAQAKLLSLEGEGRLAEVLAGTLDVEEGMQRVRPAPGASVPPTFEGDRGVATMVQGRVGGLTVLAGDRSVANPPALLAEQSTGDLLRALAGKFDYVLIDAPSPLEVSDIVPLLGVVDAIVLVARVGHSREASATLVRQLLDRPTNAPVVGVVANFVGRGELKRYGFSSLEGRMRPGNNLTGR